MGEESMSKNSRGESDGRGAAFPQGGPAVTTNNQMNAGPNRMDVHFSVQFSSAVRSCPTLCDPTDCSMPGLPVHSQLPRLTQAHIHRVGDAIQPSHPLRPLLLLPLIFPSIRVFSSESVLHVRSPKYWSFSFNICPSNEYSGLISFRMDWLDLLAVQGTLKSLLQHRSSKASILQCSAFFIVQLSSAIHDYWKNHGFDQMDLCQQSNVFVF